MSTEVEEEEDESVVCEPVRDFEDPVLIATTEMYVLPLEVYVLRLDDTDVDVVKFMLLLDEVEPVCAENPPIVPGRMICDGCDWLICAVDATMLLLEDVEDSKSLLEDDDVLLCTGAAPVVEARVTELPLPIVDAGATRLPVPDSVYSVCLWL
jgi:hypothetical protein